MTTSTLSTIVTDLPALAVICVTIYAAYWLLGLVKWPRIAGRDRLLAAWSEVDLGTQGGFRLRALGLVSVFSLYLELLLIRWVSSEIRIFAYFKSLVLIACFLGFGLGCYLTRSKIRALYTIVPVLALVLLVELPWYPQLDEQDRKSTRLNSSH